MIRKTVPILLVIIWVIVIFYFSNQDGYISQSKSLEIVKLIYRNFWQWVKDIEPDTLHYFIRKAAHVTLYFVLCLVVMNALYHGGFRKGALFFRAFIICIFYASMDELYQRFVSGRSGCFSDVLVDLIGITLGILMGIIIQGLYCTFISNRAYD